MKLDTIVGTYHEDGVWKDSTGAYGSLDGAVIVRYSEGRLEFAYGDGSRQVSGTIETQDRPIDLSGTLGDGKLFLGKTSLVLDYEAQVKGRVESNTDTWIQVGGGFRRAGVIRQGDRTIWFEAKMRKDDGGL